MPALLDMIGYVASFIILVSLLMSSVKKLRLINLFGSVIFAVYGFLILSYPTAVMNIGIVLIDLYYLVKMYKEKDQFKLVKTDANSALFTDFFAFYKEDIKSFMDIKFDLNDPSLNIYFVTRNVVPAGLFISKKEGNKLTIYIDYTIPMYRDFKIGSYLYDPSSSLCTDENIIYLSSKPGSVKHRSYLEKMGFVAVKKSSGLMMEKTLKK